MVAISGTIAGLTYVRMGDRQVIRKQAKKARRKPGQNRQPTRVKAAAAYWRSVLENPEKKAFYFALPHEPSLGAYQKAVRDFMNSPVVNEIDASQYAGRVGQSIRVAASDDTGISQLSVRITSMTGQLIEEGLAQADGTDWVYVATTHVSAGQTVTIQATAKDRPGNTGVKTCLAYAR